MCTLAAHKKDVLKGWADSYRQAYAREYEASSSRTKSGSQATPSGASAEARSVTTSSAVDAKAAEVQALVRRLQRMDVDVRP